MNKVLIGMTAVVLMAAPAVAQEVPQAVAPAYNCDFEPACEVAPGIYGKMSSPVASKFNLSFGGIVKLDYAYNSVNLGTNGALGTLIPGGIPKTSSAQGQQDQSILTARQSRFWMKADGPTLLGAKTAALIETDFYGTGAGNNEAALLRMRHAYATLDWAGPGTQLLLGQSWDIFMLSIANTVDFGSGNTTGNPGSPRVTQIRLTQKAKLSDQNTLKLVLGVQNPVQDTNLGTNAAGTDTWGGMVNVAGQAMLVSKALGTSPGYGGLSMNPLTMGFYGLYGNENVAGNAHTVDSWGYGFYALVPVLASKDGKSRAMTATLEGQAYMAANMAFNYATAKTLVGPAGDKGPAKGYGYFGQLIFYPTQELGISTGYGRRAASDSNSYVSSGIKDFEKSNSHFFANVAYDLNAAVRVAVEFQNLNTQYGNVTAGTSDHGTANVGRLAFYYFF